MHMHTLTHTHTRWVGAELTHTARTLITHMGTKHKVTHTHTSLTGTLMDTDTC